MKLFILVAIVFALSVTGCGGSFQGRETSQGLVIVLPGIEGPGLVSQNICDGLRQGGVPYAIVVYAWGAPVPLLGMLINQTWVLSNQMIAAQLAAKITAYQDSHPGKPVYIVAHSGGAGIAVFALERLGANRKIDGAVLLSASISADYNLYPALQHCRRGMVNFYNPEDFAMHAGVTVFGNIDGGHGAPAGRSGFREGWSVYTNNPKLHQVMVDNRRQSYLDNVPHLADASPEFVRDRVAPWLLAQRWPVGNP